MGIWGVTIILLVALILLVTEKITVDRTAIGIMAALMVSGILTPKEAISGFANPAVITVGSLFIISEGMVRSGVVGAIAQRVIHISGGNRNAALVITTFAVGVASAFINNTPVVVLFIPIIFSLSCEYDFSPSQVLIPMSYVSILAGTCTLIGTSTNIIASDLSDAYGYGFFTMFELAALGVPNALLGIAMMFMVSFYLMPDHTAPVCEIKNHKNQRYLTEVQVPEGSRLIGQEPGTALQKAFPSIRIIEIIRDSKIIDPNRAGICIEAEDLLLIKGSASDLVGVLQKKLVLLSHAEEGMGFGPDENELIVELIIPPQSNVLRQRLISTDLQGDPSVQIIAIKRQGVHYSDHKLRNVRLRMGDILLVRCPKAKFKRLREESDFIVVDDVHRQIIFKDKARWALLIFAGVVITAGTGLADIMVSAMVGVLLMAFTGCIQLRQAYRSLQPEVLLLVVGTIALGTAMEKTGASRAYAEAFLSLFHGLGPRYVLGGILVLTSLLSNILSNNATAVLLIPIAISTAHGLGVNAKPFIIAVCFGASACFATPIGYNTNLLVQGPGHYRFADYLKLGVPLNALVLVMGSIFIPLIWPL